MRNRTTLRRLHLLAGAVLLFMPVRPLHATDHPLQIDSGLFRLGDSPTTPGHGPAWLHVGLDGDEWQPFRLGKGHPADGFNHAWRRLRLPDADLDDPTLALSQLPSFEVYLGGSRIYVSGTLAPAFWNRGNMHRWHAVPLPRDFAGQEAFLRVYSETGRFLEVPLRAAVGNRADLIKSVLREDFGQVITGFFLMLMGLAALYIYVRRGERPALSLAILSLCVGVFTAYRTNLRDLVIGSGPVTWYVGHLTFYAFPIGLWAFLEQMVGRRCPVLRRLWQVQIVWLLVIPFLDAAGVLTMVISDIYTVYLSVALFVAIVSTFRNLLRRRSEEGDAREIALLSWGFGIMALAGVHDLLGGMGLLIVNIPLYHYGVLAFVITLAVILERRFASAHEQLQRYSTQMEGLVEIRTRDLADKNQALEKAMLDLRSAQQQLVMREKMAALGDLVAGVAHEVNTPIGAVNSSADVAERCIDRLSTMIDECPGTEELRAGSRYRKTVEMLKENTGLIRNAGARIATIVRSLRNFARLDEAEFQKADLHEGLESTLALVHHQLKNRIEVVREYGTIPAVDCYPNQLNQVFMNVLVNAAQAIDGTGTITIATEPEGDQVAIRITDTGRGIPADRIGRVFDPGFTTKGVGIGTGLGLSISYSIIQDHNGSIDVTSEPGRGTTFTIRVPINGEARPDRNRGADRGGQGPE